MRVFDRLYPASLKFSVLLFVLILSRVGAVGQQNGPVQRHSPLAEILLRKGVLTREEMKQVEAAPTPDQSELMLARILANKGVLTKSEFAQITGAAPVNNPAAVPAPASQRVQAETTPKPTAVSAVPSQPVTMQTASVTITKPQASAAVQAITPIRALRVGGVARSAEAPAVKTSGVGFTPYGAIKVTAVEDSSSPYGDDFPLPGFMCDMGPDSASEFHVKARSTRVGVNLAWNDPNPRWNITGKLEMDFEGNFNRSDNRNISSIRSNNPSLRLAWGRLDFAPDRNNVFSALFGQDWSPFGSSTLPNMLETTSMGIGYGVLYERTPQMRIGYTRRSPRFTIMPEFAITLPSAGLVPSAANVSQQLGYGERQGADSNRPDIEGRLVGQWQLDHAPGVAPAQLIISMEHGERRAVVPASSIPSPYQKTFAAGTSGSSQTYGWDFEWQLPTRFATLVGKFYSGAGLRYFFVNQLYSYYNDTSGLTNLAMIPSIDGSSTIVFGTNSAGQQVVAPERSVRTAGGFAQLGLPLSRIFKANPEGRNAGWTLYALYGTDQASARDLVHLGGSTRHASSMAVGTLNYSFNRWVSFSFEHSLYTTHANTRQQLPQYRGFPAREWHDVRDEFGPVFTF
jgi:hypothetical protein